MKDCCLHGCKTENNFRNKQARGVFQKSYLPGNSKSRFVYQKHVTGILIPVCNFVLCAAFNLNSVGRNTLKRHFNYLLRDL